MNDINRKAALIMLGMSEGTINHPLTQHAGYDVIVTGIPPSKTLEVFTDFTYHPFAIGFDPQDWRPGMIRPEWREPKVINSHGLESTAAGRYQILRRFWLSYAKSLHLKTMQPEAQDQYVIQQFKERQALDLLDQGRFLAFCSAISGLWASMPGRAYSGQQQHSLERVRGFYLAAGGVITD